MEQLTTHSIISHYRIVSKLGAGGMGEVWLAEDSRLGRKVAIKLLPAEFTEDSERVRRFTQEAKAASALNHPNIIAVHDIGECEFGRFIVMEFVAGRTLRSVIATDNSLETFFTLSRQMARALNAAHTAGITHRDIKPDNIMVRDDGYVKMLDFGLARLMPTTSSDPEAATLAHQTTPGTVMGTLAYMSPEQASGQIVGSASDVFALGIVLYELATGSHPFKSETMIGYLHAITSQTPPSMTSLKSHLPPALDELIFRMLDKDANSRPTATEVTQALQEIEKYGSSHTLPLRIVSDKPKITRGDEGFRIAVVPFKVRDADPDVAVLADGLSEEIVTGLSRFRYLSVVTTSSSPRLKGETEEDSALRAKLGARYVLEGSIRKGGSVIRVSAQLVDTETGAQLWSETYNRDLETSTVFAVQDDIAGRVVATVADSYGVLVHSMRIAMRKKDDVDLTPVEWQFQYFAYREQITPSAHAALKSRLQRVAERNVGQSDVWACLAQIYVDEYAFGFEGEANSLERALAAGRRAVELDRANQFALVALAQVHFFRRDLTAFGPAAERGMALNPLNTDALGILGLQIVHTGQFERGTVIVRRAMELNPNHAGWMHFAPLWDHFHRGEYEAALECANRVDVPGLFWPYLVMASACGHLGRRTEAEAAVKDLLSLDPEFAANVRSNVESWHFASGLMDPILEGLSKAGLAITATDGSSDSPMGTVTAKVDRAEASRDSGAVRAEEGFWVAVLPFKYSGSNGELASLADGLSEDVMTGLSRFSYLRVIARNSTLDNYSNSSDARTVGQTLGARYLMEGSLRQSGTKLRLAVQLVDTTTGAHLWAENYERAFSPETIFELQDDLVPRVVSTVADQYGALVHSMSESLRGKSVGQYSAHEAMLRAFGYWERMTPEEHAEVRDILEAAVAVAPDHSDCLAELAMIYWHEYAFGYNLKPDPVGRARAAAQRAVASAPTSHFAHCALATSLFFQKDYLAFRPAAERALALNRMDSSTAAILGNMIAYTGDWDYGLGIVKRAMQLNPHHAGWYHYVAFCDAYRKHDYHGALAIALKVNMPAYHWPNVYLAAVYGQLGEQQRATVALRELHALVPNFGAIAREEFGKWLDPELTEHLLDGLRKAGLETGDGETGRDGDGEKKRDVAPSPTHPVTPSSSGSLIKSIAVLPFQNLSVDPEQEFFADGITEEILNALAQIKELRVAGRSSSFSFKGRNEDLRSVGAKLNVTSILEGTLRRSGDRLRITAQLIDAVSGYQLWSERYDRILEDIFNVQDEIALAIVGALKLKLFGDAKEAVVKRYTDDAEVHELFLKGRYYSYKYTAEGWTRAVEFFEKVIEKQPRHAPAHAGKAAALGCLWFFGLTPADEAVPPSRSAATKAIELDGNLAGAHLSLALLNFFYDWEWEKAEQEFKQAILLNPKDAEALSYYAMFLGFVDRFDEAMALARRALEVDPLSLLINMNVGWTYFSAGLAYEAVDQARKMTEIEPGFFGAYWLNGATCLANGDYEEAIEQLTKAVSLGAHPIVLADLGAANALAGKKETAKTILDQLLEMRQQSYAPAICLARVYSRLGELEKTIQWLETAYEERNGELVFLESEITSAAKGDSLNSLGKDPRVMDLLERMKLPSREASRDQGD